MFLKHCQAFTRHCASSTSIEYSPAASNSNRCTQHAPQVTQLIVRQESGRAASHVELADNLPTTPVLHMQINLALQIAQMMSQHVHGAW